MGIDLTLLIKEKGASHAHTQLALNRCTQLFELIEELPLVPLASVLTKKNSFNSYCGGSSGATYGRTVKDSYGEPLNVIEIADLLSLRKHEGVNEYGGENRAAWSYLSRLEKDRWHVVLYWH